MTIHIGHIDSTQIMRNNYKSSAGNGCEEQKFEGTNHVVVVFVVVLVVAFVVDVALSLWWKIESQAVIAGKSFLSY